MNGIGKNMAKLGITKIKKLQIIKCRPAVMGWESLVKGIQLTSKLKELRINHCVMKEPVLDTICEAFK